MPQPMLQRLSVDGADYGIRLAGVRDPQNEIADWPWRFRGQLPARIYAVTPQTGGVTQGDELLPSTENAPIQSLAKHGYTPAA